MKNLLLKKFSEKREVVFMKGEVDLLKGVLIEKGYKEVHGENFYLRFKKNFPSGVETDVLIKYSIIFDIIVKERTRVGSEYKINVSFILNDESGDKILQDHPYHGQDIEEEEKLAESFEQWWNKTERDKGFKLWNNFWKQKRSALPVLKAMLIDYYIEEMNKAVECTKKGDEKIHDNSTTIIGDIYFKIFKEEIYDEPSVNERIKDWENTISQRNMESSIKDKYIILGFVGFAIVLISSIATLVIADSFNQDNFVRWIVFVCCNLLGWLLYLSFQTLIFDTYEIYKIKFGKKETIAEAIEVQEELSQNTLETNKS